jgi:transcriptional regulator with XRE-family HTH domain
MAEPLPDENVELVPSEGKPFAALGRFLRSLRVAKGLSQLELAAKAEMDNAQISRMERGENVYLSQYQKYAVALGYRNLLQMFQAPADPDLRKLLRLWAMLDDEERKDVLAKVQDWIAAR